MAPLRKTITALLFVSPSDAIKAHPKSSPSAAFVSAAETRDTTALVVPTSMLLAIFSLPSSWIAEVIDCTSAATVARRGRNFLPNRAGAHAMGSK